MFKDLKISTKLIIGFIIIALLVGVIGLVGINTSKIVKEPFKEVREEFVPAVLVLGNIRSTSRDIILAVHEYLLYGEERYKKDFEDSVIVVVANFEAYEQAEAGEEAEIIESFKQHIATLTSLGRQVIQLKDSGATEETILLEEEKFQQAHKAFGIALLEEIDEDQEDLEQAYTKAENIIEQSRNFILSIILFVSTLTISLGYFISRSISKPIKNLSQTARAIIGGDLTKRTEVISKDEIGQLAQSFNQMTDKLVRALQKQKEYAAKRVAKIVPILQKISMGDFSKKLKIPEKEDEFTELLVALDLMIDDLKETEKVREEAEEAKVAVATERARSEEIKKGEMILREEKNKLQKYFDVAGVTIIVLSPEQKVLLINKKGQEILECVPKEIINKDWFINFVPKQNRAEARAIFEKLMTEKVKGIRFFEGSILTKSGKKRIIAWQNTLLNDEKGNPQAVLTVGVDVTELRQAKVTIEQLEELNKLKDDFLNIAAHELRTPLTSIIGLSEVINNQEPSLTSKNKRYIDIIHGEGIKLSHIIKRILTVTRFESGRETVQLEPFNLITFISLLLPTLKVIAKKKNSKIITNIEKKNIVIKSDKEKISQVIYNFIDNAVKYGPESQTITISVAQPEKNWVKVEVIDQGQGIVPELKKKLFTKFSQLEPSLIRSQEGTGLGLYICKLIIDRLGGKIGVKSKLGEGSTFYFTLPVYTKKA